MLSLYMSFTIGRNGEEIWETEAERLWALPWAEERARGRERRERERAENSSLGLGAITHFEREREENRQRELAELALIPSRGVGRPIDVEARAQDAKKKKEATQRRVGRTVTKRTGTTTNPEIDTKVNKQLPLLPQERSNMFNTLNKMSQEQLRKYVSNFNTEARIVGGHAMKKDDLINAIIAKAKVVENLLKKLRVDVPKMDISAKTKESTGTRVIAKDSSGTKARETKPGVVPVGESFVYGRVSHKGTKEGVFLPGYAIKPISANRFENLEDAQKACSKTGKCNGITTETIKGKVYYSMRNGVSAGQDGKAGTQSWKKKTVTRIKLK